MFKKVFLAGFEVPHKALRILLFPFAASLSSSGTQPDGRSSLTSLEGLNHH